MRLALLSLVASLLLFVRPGAAQPPIIEYLFAPDGGSLAFNSGSLAGAGNGVLVGPILVSEHEPRASTGSAAFDGAGDYIRVTNNFSYGSALTVEAWVYPAQADGQRVVWDDYGNPGVLLTVLSSALQFNISTAMHPGLGIGVVAGGVPVDQWTHIAGTYDGALARTYINGVEVGSAATTGAIQENAVAPALGSDNVSTNQLNFHGNIDDFRIFPRALAPSELAGGAFACAADFNHDGFVDPDDLADFITCFFLDVQFPGTCASSDLNGDGFRDPDDLADFITAFFLGCP